MGKGLSILVLVVGVLLFIFAPFVTIGAINTLFGTAIAWNFWNWLSMVWLTLVFGGAAAVAK